MFIPLFELPFQLNMSFLHKHSTILYVKSLVITNKNTANDFTTGKGMGSTQGSGTAAVVYFLP